MSNIENIYKYIKKRSKEIKEQNKDLPAYIIIPSYLTCSKVIVGNPAPNINVNTRYVVQNIDTSYYTTFKINLDL